VPTIEPDGLAEAADAEGAAALAEAALLVELLEQPARTATPRAPTAAMARAVVEERFMVMPFVKVATEMAHIRGVPSVTTPKPRRSGARLAGELPGLKTRD
jgi:hypothetical protein